MKVVETKERRIELLKAGVHFDIDSLTFKMTESTMQAADQKAKSAVASDKDEAFDSAILNRLTDFRDATIRKRMQFCLKDEEIVSFTNKPSEDPSYVYILMVPVGFKDTSLPVIGTKLHEYLVKGALLDWYIQTGVNVSTNALAAQVQELEDTIIGLLRVPSTLRKPLQPFGPQ